MELDEKNEYVKNVRVNDFNLGAVLSTSVRVCEREMEREGDWISDVDSEIHSYKNKKIEYSVPHYKDDNDSLLGIWFDYHSLD